MHIAQGLEFAKGLRLAPHNPELTVNYFQQLSYDLRMKDSSAMKGEHETQLPFSINFVTSL